MPAGYAMRNMRLPAFRIALPLATALLVGRAQAADLEVATATVDITAPSGYPMGGYGARKGVSTGVHDPLLAKTLLIKSGGQQFGIVTYDLVGIASQRVAREAREVLGLSAVLQIASHTHSGPVPKNLKDPEHDPWYRGMEDKVLGALKAAQSRYEPAQFGVTQGSIYIGHNRRKVSENGTVTMFWRNSDRLPTHPVDPRLGIFRFTGADGHVIALLVNYACHAVVLGPDNLQFSADWPGYMSRRIERELGNPAVSFFVPGAGGDINPYDDKTPIAENAFGIAQRTGESVSDAVLKALSNKPPAAEDFDLRISQQTYNFKNRFDPQARVPTQVTHLMLAKDVGVFGDSGRAVRELPNQSAGPVASAADFPVRVCVRRGRKAVRLCSNDSSGRRGWLRRELRNPDRGGRRRSHGRPGGRMVL